ncbi:hypothetical protein I3760_16G100700 [Carya illinoinensis]|nr:hypothetical protein I3760_16G100700 [Carya illinoinensis]
MVRLKQQRRGNEDHEIAHVSVVSVDNDYSVGNMIVL